MNKACNKQQRAPPRATAWAPRSSSCDAQRVAPRVKAGRNDPVPTTHNGRIGLGTAIKYLRGAAGIGLGTTIKYLRGAAGVCLGTAIENLRRSTSGAAGNGMCTTIKYLRGAAGIGLGTTINYLRRTAIAAAGSGLGSTIKYLVNQNAGSGSNWVKAHNEKNWARTHLNPPGLKRFL
jgi:hypothetical protein